MREVLLFIWEAFHHSLQETATLLPFLFLTYLCMEWVEHRMAGGAQRFIRRSGKLGPLVGGVLGVVPQCGFGAVAANFYAGRMISAGTLVAIFLSTSDEMLPILISGKASLSVILCALGVKVLVGVLVGFLLDLFLTLRHTPPPPRVEGLCEEEHCHCEEGILRSALHHTLHIGGFVLLFTFVIHGLVHWVGEDRLSLLLDTAPGLSHVLCSLVGLIPNCACSVVLTNLYLSGLISFGAMLSGLLPGAGVGLLVLLRMNKHKKENLLLLGLLVLVGIVTGLVLDGSGLSQLLT